MKVFSWNVREICSTSRQRVIRDWVNTNRPVIGAILETRSSQENSDAILLSTFPGWRSETNYSESDMGRIWVVWNSSLSVIIYKKTAQMILCGVLDPATNVSFSAAFVYGFNTVSQRIELWRDITELSTSTPLRNSPWVLLGDFNQILQIEEHHSIIPYDAPLRGMADLRSCMEDNNLTDLSSRGTFFT